MCQSRLERLLVVRDRTTEWQTRKLGEMIGAERGSKALLAQGLEHRPGDGIDVAGIAFKHVKPVLRNPSEVEGCQPNFVSFSRALGSEEMFTLIELA